MELFKYKIQNKKFVVFITEPDGELDYSNLDKFSKVLKAGIKQEYKEITVDFKNLIFIDSSGLGRLIAASKDAKINIINCNDNIKKIFKMTNLMPFFNVK